MWSCDEIYIYKLYNCCGYLYVHVRVLLRVHLQFFFFLNAQNNRSYTIHSSGTVALYGPWPVFRLFAENMTKDNHKSYCSAAILFMYYSAVKSKL